MAQFLFGSGILWGTPLTNASGATMTTPSPVQFGVLQDVSVDISFDTKMLYGQSQFAVAAGRGKGHIAGKAKFAQLNGAILNGLFFGQTVTAGLLSDVYDTSGTAIPTTPFQITPTVPNSGTWTQDLGVRDANNLPLTRVASAPATGQYSVAAGVYTFASADSGSVVFINFQYTASSSVARKSSVSNLAMGPAPTFRCDLFAPYGSKQLVLTISQCVCTKLMLATKMEDFVVPEFDFQGFSDGSNNVLTWALSE
jgi:hypothetical protein